MTAEPTRRRSRLILAVIVAVVLVAGVAATIFAIPALTPKSTTGPTTTYNWSGTTFTRTLTGYPSGEPYLNSTIYAPLGYPQLTYSNTGVPYVQDGPNYTVDYEAPNLRLQLGTTGGDVIDLSQAVGIAAAYAGLSPDNLSLGAAQFELGSIVNASLNSDPSWDLFFATSYQGFWTFGSCGDGDFALQSTFAVDAQTGQLVSAWAQENFPNTQFESAQVSLNDTTLSNLRPSDETFQINAGIVGDSGYLSVMVPGIIVATPGSTGSVTIDTSSPCAAGTTTQFSFVNPLPGIQPSAVPAGVSTSFAPQSPTITGAGNTTDKLSFSVSKYAPPGTYLLEITAQFSWPSVGSYGTGQILFLFSVWNGTGLWPSPPE